MNATDGILSLVDDEVLIADIDRVVALSLIHISEPTRLSLVSRMPSSA